MMSRRKLDTDLEKKPIEFEDEDDWIKEAFGL